MLRLIMKGTVAVVGLAAASMPAFGQGASFRLTNNALGPDQSFEAVQLPDFSAPAGVMMSTSNVNEQYWQSRRSGRFFQLINVRDGPRMCLEVNASGGATFMNPCGPQMAQRWQVEELQGGVVRLRNPSQPGRCLDVVTHDKISFPVMTSCQASLNSQKWSMPSAGRP